MGETYETHVEGIRIFPGQWRPHYPWEHIVWISPSWPCQDYLWLDFPETFLSDAGFHYISNKNPVIPAEELLFSSLPPVPWTRINGGLSYERTLPGGVSFGGSVSRKSTTRIALELHITNGSGEALTGVNLRTCIFLRATRDFGQYTNTNKYAFVEEHGWVSFEKAREVEHPGRYAVTGRGSTKAFSDLPFAVCASSLAQRLVAMTWYDHTFQFGGNPTRPCLHADPECEDLGPGETVSMNGEIFFFEGSPDEFLAFWQSEGRR